MFSEFIMRAHQGEWIGMKLNHKKLRFTRVDIDKVVDEKIVEHGGAVNVNTFDTLYEHGLIWPV